MRSYKKILLFGFAILFVNTTRAQDSKTEILKELERIENQFKDFSAADSDTFLIVANYFDSLANQSKDSNFIAKGLYFIAEGLEYHAHYDSSIQFINKALPIFKRLEDSVYLASSYNHKGLALWRMGNLLESSENHIKALKIQERTKNEDGKAYSNNFLGMIMRQLGRDSESIKYYRRALKARKALKDTINMAAVYSNIGNVLRGDESYDSSLFYQQKALKLHRSQNDIKSMFGIYQNKGVIFYYMEDFDSAFFYYQKSFEMSKKLNDRLRVGLANYNLGNVLTRMGKPKEAIEFMEKSLIIAKEIKDFVGVQYAHEGLSGAYDELGNSKKAIYHYGRFRDLKDSLSGARANEKIAEIEEKYESEQKTARIKLLKKKDEIKTLKLQNSEAIISKQNRLILFTIVLFSILIIGGVIFWQLQVQKQRNRIQQQELEHQKQMLENTVHSQEEERKRIAKDLHDGIAQSLSGLKLAFVYLNDKISFNKNELKEKYNEALDALDDACIEVRNISHQMMPRVLLESGLIAAIDDMLGKTLGNAKIGYNYEHIGFNNERLSETIEISLYRICQELIQNTIKHSEASKVEINLMKTKESVILVVEDNGKGINGESNDGIGLLNIKSRANTLKGNVNFDSLDGSGLSATIRIPLIA
jgi:signal transduction histidine kinase